MSLSSIILKHDPSRSEQARAWEGLGLDLQVLLGCGDGAFSGDERLALTMQGGLVQDAEQIHDRITTLEQRIRTQTPAAVTRDLMDTLESLYHALPDPLREPIVQKLFDLLLTLAKADRVIHASERRFLLDEIAPRLALSRDQAEALIEAGVDALSRMNIVVRRAFELYLLMVDSDPDAPRLDDDDDAEALPPMVDGFIRKIREHRLGSPEAVGFFCGLLGGIEALSKMDHFASLLAEWAAALRHVVADHGPEVALQRVGLALEPLRPAERASVIQHIIGVLSQILLITPRQRRFLRDHLAPVLDMDLRELDEMASTLREANPNFYNNLVGHKRWWKFWS